VLTGYLVALSLHRVEPSSRRFQISNTSAAAPTLSASSEYIRAIPNTTSLFVTIAVGPKSTTRSMFAAR
jgi:hypothetical protein